MTTETTTPRFTVAVNHAAEKHGDAIAGHLCSAASSLQLLATVHGGLGLLPENEHVTMMRNAVESCMGQFTELLTKVSGFSDQELRGALDALQHDITMAAQAQIEGQALIARAAWAAARGA